MPGALGDVFLNGDSYVAGLTFNDVAIAVTDYSGCGPVEIARWTLDGRRIDSPAKGINIVRYSDGTSRKIFVK